MKKEFDLIVIGGGSGLTVSAAAVERGLKTAVIEEGPLGGTCLNRGCIPSKVLIHSADVAEIIDNSDTFGIKAKRTGVDFGKIVKRAFTTIDKDAASIEQGIKQTKEMTLFKGTAKFVGKNEIQVGKDTLRGKYIIIAAGTRPTIPPIEGMKKVKYYTSDNVMRIKKQPKSMIVLGGGFIAAELAHFFGALGTSITIVQRSTLLRHEDKEIADTFTRLFSKKHNVVLGYGAKSVKQKGNKITLMVQTKEGRKTKKIEAETLLVATGRVPNTDLLDVKKGGIATNEKGYIKTNPYLETTAKNVWALGDIVGNYLLKHSANLEAQYVVNNIFGKRKVPIDYWPMPHAVFSSPQMAAVGYTEEELKAKKINYAVGKYNYQLLDILMINIKNQFQNFQNELV